MQQGLYNKLSEVLHNNLCYGEDTRHLRKYLLKERGITKDTIIKYKLGAMHKDLRKLAEHIPWDELINNGIIWNAGDGPFRQYPVVVPVHDVYGNTIAIGCRTLMTDDEREVAGIPKYRNSVYSKTSHLFGLDKAISAIRKTGTVSVVEGYFDVLAAHQNGIMNVVATCGTIFSRRQLIILSRYAKNVVLLFDNDKPGRLSSERVCQKLEHIDHTGVTVTSKFTPDGYKDLDEFFLKGGDYKILGLEKVD